ncbi:MAG: acyl--CoA ligase [Oscillospiraceae bacterium]|nr:acyl--CoA ligase [Oscillospiraceae bacterium]
MGFKKITEEQVWMKYYPEEARNAPLPRCKAFDHVIAENEGRLDSPALHYYGTDITFRELIRRVDEIAASFTALGVKEGDVVSFLSATLPETIAAVYALNKIGAAANTIDPRLDVGSIRRMITGSGSKILVVVDIAFPKVRPIMSKIRQDKIVVQSAYTSLHPVKRFFASLSTKTDVPYDNDVIDWKHFLRLGRGVEVVESPYQGDALVAITYTGGTTGTPKGVMITNDSMNAVAMNFKYCGVYHNDDDRFLGIIPIFSAYGMVCGMHMPLCLRTTLVPIPRFIPQQIGRLVMQFKPQHLISTPVFIELLIGSKEVRGKDLSFLYTLASGGDTMNEGLESKLDAFRREHGMRFPLAQGYGMSELSAAASFCVNEVYKKGSVGVPSLNVTVGIFDPDTGEEMGYHEKGEVCVTGPTMMKAYFNTPEETAYVMRTHEDGKVWIHSGDVGYMDEDGFLFILGRIKRMITRFDGHKVFPVNMESLIAQRPDVHNCVVVGVNDRIHSQGQYPLALVELMDGVDPSVCREIYRFCHEELEERGRPVAVLAVDELPLTPMGKIDIRALEEQYKRFDYLAW